MLIVQTPFRMSFFGGGTDIPEYYEQYGGKVLSTTFDKYCYHTVRYFPQFFPYKNQLTYSKIERFENANEVEHPAVREILKYLEVDKVQITYDADLPARSGLGTSSSFAVGLLNGLHSLKGEFVDKMTLAKEAIYVERTLCKEDGGVQDQLAASFGGLNKMSFSSDGFEVNPVVVKSERKKQLNDNLMLFFTGFVRFSGDVMCEQIKKAKKNTADLKEMAAMVDEGERILVGSGDLGDFGRLLNHSWQLKRSLSNNVTTDAIDDIYDRARKAGAIGGKLLGAGAGGFMLLYVEPEKQQSVKEELHEFMNIPFEFESSGTKVIYYKL